MTGHMVLDEDHNLVPADLQTWARYFEEMRRVVGQTDVAGAHVSTVFLGIDHSFGRGPGLWFETMIFRDGDEDGVWRYTTWEQAEAGHERVVAALREGREP